MDVPEAESADPGAHRAKIAWVGVADRGAVALTVDTAGAVRLWPTLDGKEEPRAVSVPSLQQMSFARNGSGFVVAGIDASGTGRLIAIAPDGVVQRRVQIPPFPPTLDIEVVPDYGVLTVGRDHVVRRFGLDGSVAAAWSERRFRGQSIAVSDDGRFALIIGVTADGRGADVRRLALGEDAIETESSSFVSRLPLRPVIAVSQDAARVALLGDPGAEAMTLIVHNAVSGDIETTTKLPLSSAEGISFSRDDRLIVCEAHSIRVRTLYSVELPDGDRQELRFFEGEASAPACFQDRCVLGREHWLGVVDVSVTDNTLDSPDDYVLGHHFGTVRVALSADGKRVAWSYGLGRVFVDEVGGQISLEPLDAGLLSAPRVAFLPDGRLLTLSGLARVDDLLGASEGVLSVFDLETGKTLAKQGKLGLPLALSTHPKRPLAIVLTDEKAILADFTDPAAPKMSTLEAILNTQKLAHRVRVGFVLGGRYTDSVWIAEERVVLFDAAPGDRDTAPLTTLGEHIQALDAVSRGYSWVTGDRPFSATATDRVLLNPDIVDIKASPNGGVILAQSREDMLVGVNGSTFEPMWSLPAPGVKNLDDAASFSADGSRVAISHRGGGVVLQTTTGKRLHQRCTSELERRHEPIVERIAAPTRTVCD